MKSNSMSRIMLSVVLSISLIATGCSAQWISVALADLPVLTQMALNLAALAATLQTGKQRVRVTAVEPIGNYAVRLVFDDGHNTGLYSWDLLHELGRDAATNWARYLERCTAAGVRHGG